MALDPSIVLLIGADTALVDESSYARTLTAVGNAARTTAQAKYGVGSITFDGTGDRVKAADSTDFEFVGGNFTIEGWFRLLVKTTTQTLISRWSALGAQQSWALYHTGGQLDFRTGPTGSYTDLLYTWTPTLGQWYHIAVDRSGTTLRLYVDGAVVATDAAFSKSISDTISPLVLGALDDANTFPTFDYNGQMDEIRVTKGVAQYHGAFTPPTGPFPRDTFVTVPNVVGLTQAAATTAITAVGLTLGTVTTATSPTVPAGSVISQSPAAAASVALGSAVALVVSTGPALVTVPNVVGLTQAAATTAITGVGLTLGTVTTASSPTVPAGSVISQSPAAATSVALGSAVALVVSTGPAIVTVPNVVGMTQAAATTAFAAAGLTLGTVTYATSSTVPDGIVISQGPAAGASVPAGSAIDLVVAGPALVTVPNVVGMTQAEAMTALTAAGLTFGTATNATSLTVPSGSVISQSLAAGASVAPGSAVDLVISTGPAGTARLPIIGWSVTTAEGPGDPFVIMLTLP